ncbi:FAD-binding oxidoreductase [Bacillus sp. 1P06AnD]|uniref:FAD-binding oxidoreductase n=1 Tax=Bacillus sp. 1P06AnD TaxID=3132208 RepID=UPI00399EF242
MAKKWLNEMMELIGAEKISTNETALYQYSKDESFHSPVMPDAVAFPESTFDVMKIVETARKHGVPITDYGAGSGLEGQSIPLKKGLSISFEQMKNIISFSPEDLAITVQPGITRMELNQAINKHGLYFPIDPGADASIGGMVATNASGTTAVRYGAMRDQILDLEVVLSDGKVIHTGSRAKKSSSGYHLNGLFAGSEGTLGIITEITLKLHGIPEHTVAARCTFTHLKDCIEASQAVLQYGIPVLRMELVDAPSIRQVNVYGDYDYPEYHSLFFEFAGTKGNAEEDANTVEQLMSSLGCMNWERENDSMKRAQLWKARHEMAYAFRHKKGLEVSGADACVPISQLAEIIMYTRDLIDGSGLLGGILGHVGDGNFHTLVMYDPNQQDEVDAAEEIKELITFRAIELGGTCTGEHGVGIGKMKYQKAEHGLALKVMQQIKHVFDPDQILNPGKMFIEKSRIL